MLELYGASYSVFVRAVRIALEEKGTPYTLVPVDVFGTEGLPPGYLDLQPFGKIPALVHDGFTLYETAAILSYIDETFDGRSLHPNGLRERARMVQILSILQNAAYSTLVWDIYVERIAKPREGEIPDEVKIASGLGPARTVCNALEAITDSDGPFILGDQITQADCLAAPIFSLFAETEESKPVLAQTPRLSYWLNHILRHPSVLATNVTPSG
ncbi:glutathione S-transferase family protein [Roseibium denhamense]|uniref:Glutathione S-transferase n=1 Tax=Roseibium denhamense TaxID=76305 RepID=A0ABY1N7I1_9HYPH|nr:glutathione S-transferase family protein [Roseibium denhamense]MTI05984.1 glutathione S-transferase family protein [Roseibium denhamense]SMP02500.1 glutathione S-transferase [Roseibium denhamense]